MVKIKTKILLLVVLSILMSFFASAAIDVNGCEFDWEAPYHDDDNDDCDGANIPPGADVEMSVDIENTFSDDLEDVSVELVIENIDDEGDDDISEESDEEDIDEGDEETFKISFEIPLKVDIGSYDAHLNIEAKNATDNSKIKYTYNFSIDVDKERNHVVFTQTDIFPESIKCSGFSEVDVEIYNLGEKKEKDVEIAIKNSQLDLNTVVDDIDLDDDPFDEDAEYSTTFTVDIAEGTSAGTYPLYLTATYDDGDKTANARVDLVVEACTTTSPPSQPEEPEEDEEDTNDDVVVITPTPDENEPDTTTEPTINVPSDIVVAQNKDDNNLVMIIIALEVIIVIVGIILAIAWLSKK